jgi:hypothetical protein
METVKIPLGNFNVYVLFSPLRITSQAQWLTPVISAIREAEIRSIGV